MNHSFFDMTLYPLIFHLFKIQLATETVGILQQTKHVFAGGTRRASYFDFSLKNYST